MATTKPLTICVAPELFDQPWVAELKAKGHLVHDGVEYDLWGADLILGPTCARFLPGMEQFLPEFLKGARAIKYKGKKDD